MGGVGKGFGEGGGWHWGWVLIRGNIKKEILDLICECVSLKSFIISYSQHSSLTLLSQNRKKPGSSALYGRMATQIRVNPGIIYYCLL